MRRLRWLGLAMLVLVVGCASSQPKNSFELAVGDDGIAMELSRDVVLNLLEDSLDSSIDCSGDTDDELYTLLAPLAKRRYASNSLGDREERLTASRRGSRLRLSVTEDHRKRLELTLPWSFAECVLGGRITLADALEGSPITLVVLNDDGTRVKASVR